MKKWKRMLLAGLAAGMLTMATAAASSFDSTADTLKNMGLFAGTNTGYELDRAPTRAEAATMLVRLLGKTAEAETQWAATSQSFVFRDMDSYDWAKPYVHWLAQKQLAAGTSANRFSPSEPCTAQMYAAFLLRSLGYYESRGDFAFADALEFARAHGIIEEENCDTARFLRDHVVATSYTALAAQPKSGESDLLTKLVGEGAVSAEIAVAEQQKFAAYRGYRRVLEGAADGAALENVTSLSVSGGMSLEVAAVSQTRVRDGRLSSEGTLTMTVPGMDPFVEEHSGYYADGRWYTAENGIKTWRTAAMDSVLREVSQPEPVPLCLLEQVRTTSSGYALTFSEAGKSWYVTELKLMESALGSTLGLEDLQIGELSAEIRATNGTLVSLSSSVTVSGKMNHLTQGGKAEVSIRAQQNSSMTASGDGVTVTPPADLGTYQQAQ